MGERTGGHASAFEWFAAQPRAVRQLALSWDVSQGNVEHPAVQLLLAEQDAEVACGFLASAGREDASHAYRTFVSRLPKGWFACYVGVFPGRQGHYLRVECIPSRRQQKAYAKDPETLRAHLAQVGYTSVSDTLLRQCKFMADTPFVFELQFDVTPDGTADTTIGASLRFAYPSASDMRQAFDPRGEGGRIMRQVQGWGLADDRWRLLSEAAFSKRTTLHDASWLLYCYVAFLKIRWRDGTPLDAKAYYMAGVR